MEPTDSPPFASPSQPTFPSPPGNISSPRPFTNATSLVPNLDLHDLVLDENATSDNVIQVIKTFLARWDAAEKDLERPKTPTALDLITDLSAAQTIKALDKNFSDAAEVVLITTLYNIVLQMDYQKSYRIHPPFHTWSKQVMGDNIQAYFLCKLLAGHLTDAMVPEVTHFIAENANTSCVLVWNDGLFNSPNASESILTLIKTPTGDTYTTTTKSMMILRAMRSEDVIIKSSLPDLFANLGADAYAAEVGLRPLLLGMKDYRTSPTVLACLTAFLPHVTDPEVRSHVNFDLALMGQPQAIIAARLEASNDDNPTHLAIQKRINEMCQAYQIPYQNNPQSLLHLQWNPTDAEWFLSGK
jgi:hypothetical protein